MTLKGEVRRFSEAITNGADEQDAIKKVMNNLLFVSVVVFSLWALFTWNYASFFQNDLLSSPFTRGAFIIVVSLILLTITRPDI